MFIMKKMIKFKKKLNNLKNPIGTIFLMNSI